MSISTFARTLALTSALFASGAAMALEPAEGEILLTVTGEIGQTNAGDMAEFDRALLEGLGTVAFLRNGDEMSVREKGPLWVVYPYDSTPEYQSELIYSRSVWQLARIEVQP